MMLSWLSKKSGDQVSLSQEKIRAIAAECVAVADDELHQQFLQYMGMAPQDFVALSDLSENASVWVTNRGRNE